MTTAAAKSCQSFWDRLLVGTAGADSFETGLLLATQQAPPLQWPQWPQHLGALGLTLPDSATPTSDAACDTISARLNSMANKRLIEHNIG